MVSTHGVVARLQHMAERAQNDLKLPEGRQPYIVENREIGELGHMCRIFGYPVSSYYRCMRQAFAISEFNGFVGQ